MTPGRQKAGEAAAAAAAAAAGYAVDLPTLMAAVVPWGVLGLLGASVAIFRFDGGPSWRDVARMIVSSVSLAIAISQLVLALAEIWGAPPTAAFGIAAFSTLVLSALAEMVWAGAWTVGIKFEAEPMAAMRSLWLLVRRRGGRGDKTRDNDGA